MLIFAYSQSPPFCIVEDEDGYWLVPRRPGGWNLREAFVGRANDLTLLDQSALAEELGIPNSGV